MAFNRRQTASLIAVFAAGTLFALSFVATPVKFLAEGVTISDLLAVGRVTFRASLVVELAFVSVLVIVATGRSRALAISIIAMPGVQHLGLMPALDARTLATMAGETLAPSHLHTIWIGLDVAKLSALLWIGLASSREWKKQ